jgi:hypothetical protein
MSEPNTPTELELAKLLEVATVRMLEARKALDEYEEVHGFAGSPEHARLERQFSSATEAYLRFTEGE